MSELSKTEETVRRYRDALEEIAALDKVTEMRGPLADIGIPEHLVKDGGWVPVDPRFKSGLCYAAQIARAELDASEPAVAETKVF